MVVGSGIDVVEVARIERALERRGVRFERRVFSAAEIAECRRGPRPAREYAARFAAKEATMKAVGTGWARGVRFVDIEALAGASGGPLRIRLRGRVAARARELGAARQHLSVSRDRTHAFAVVLLEADG
ncbi:MAG: holo-ACP synthase [Myxococcota bacterium]